MEEVDHIIFHSLARIGVKFPDTVTKLSDFPEECVIGALKKCLDVITNNDENNANIEDISDSLTNKLYMADHITGKIKGLGFSENLACEQILYPNEVTMRKLFMFLIGKMTQLSDKTYATTPRDSQTFLMTMINKQIAKELRSVKTSNNIPHKLQSSNTTSASTEMSEEPLTELPEICIDDIIQEMRNKRHENINYSHIILAANKQKSKPQVKVTRQEIRDTVQNITDLKKKKQLLLSTLEAKKKELNELNGKKDTIILASNLTNDCEENFPKLLKIAEKETLKIKTISEEIEEKQKYIKESNKDLNNAEEKLISSKNSLKACQERFENLRDELELKCKVLEHLKQELENRRNQNTRVKDRHSYTKKIMEILSHIGKQKVEVNKILSDTRAVQKEMNNVHGKFERSFMVVDEIIFQDAKKDEFARQLYKKVAEVRTTCDRISTKIAECGTCTCDIRSLANTVNREKKKNIANNIDKANQDLSNNTAS